MSFSSLSARVGNAYRVHVKWRVDQHIPGAQEFLTRFEGADLVWLTARKPLPHEPDCDPLAVPRLACPRTAWHTHRVYQRNGPPTDCTAHHLGKQPEWGKHGAGSRVWFLAPSHQPRPRT
jgi:hypothetical protein